MQSCLELIPEDIERVYLAYSGGLDSSVLLHLLASNQDRYTLVPWHVNHGLLEAAVRMEQFCMEQAQLYGLELRLDRLELGDIASNIEAEARRQRYDLFAAGNDANSCIVTAHHADDQAETFLLNALRGSGSAGLRGIARSRSLGNGLLLRPLLDFSRQQLEEYASDHDLAWFNDPSNRDNRFDRNYLRNAVIPAIRRRWPKFQQALATASRLQAETQQILDEMAQLDFQGLCVVDEAAGPTLDVAGLLQLSNERARNLLRYWVASAGLSAIPAARLREVMSQLHAKPGSMPQIAMPDYSIRSYDQRLFLVRNDAMPECRGVFEFDLSEDIEIAEFEVKMRRADLFRRLQVDEREQRVTLRYPGSEHRPDDRHKLKRLYQKHRIPPWVRQSTAQVFLDDKLVDLLP